MSLNPDEISVRLPAIYSQILRNLVINYLATDLSKRPTIFDLLGVSIDYSNWDLTYVSPYDVLVALDFNSILWSSWYDYR
jgi:hypothetical protein